MMKLGRSSAMAARFLAEVLQVWLDGKG